MTERNVEFIECLKHHVHPQDTRSQELFQKLRGLNEKLVILDKKMVQSEEKASKTVHEQLKELKQRKSYRSVVEEFKTLLAKKKKDE